MVKKLKLTIRDVSEEKIFILTALYILLPSSKIQ